MTLDRRAFLFSAAAAASHAATGGQAGPVRHLLPTVSDRRLLLKASFHAPYSRVVLRIGKRRVAGRQSDSGGRHWHFDSSGLEPATQYHLQLEDPRSRLIGEPWPITTFPDPGERPARLRLAIYTCAGGPEGYIDDKGRNWFLPLAARRRLLQRVLKEQPDALVAIGDHVYWDLRSKIAQFARSEKALREVGVFDRRLPVIGSSNEEVFTRCVGAQVADLYGTLFRSTPVFFVQDDHDYFDNDEAGDDLVTFPPDEFMMRVARAARRLFYPEFLPDDSRPDGLPGVTEGARLGESFGTLRYGKLFEAVMYDCRRNLSLSGPSAGFVDPGTEQWLIERTASAEATHLMHVPSTPFGWSAGKWGEWYPDILDAAGKLTTRKQKPYWQSGWRAQHDRILKALAANQRRIPLIVSGDLHSLAVGRILRSGSLDLRGNPVHTVVSGPIGTGQRGWPSNARGTRALPPDGLEIEEKLPALEKNGFTIADITHEAIRLRFYQWPATDELSAIDGIKPFREETLTRW
ncbi:MAG: alkaline phosphatase D family protein [Bryobacteraceae bacterium]